MSIKQTLRIMVVAALLCGVVVGQSTMGTMTGTVTDPSGAAVPGAQVEARNLRTTAVRNTVTGPEGIFV